MSIRPEKVQQRASSFSLTDYVGQTTATHAAVTRPMFNLSGISQTQSSPAPAVPVAGKLSFNLGAASRLPAQAAAIHQQAPPLPNLTFALNKTDPVAGLASGRGDPGHEVMRLAGLLEDQKNKLNTSTQRLAATEASVARANQALTSERTAAAARVAQLSAELRLVRDTEQKLRQELAASPAAADLERQRVAFKIQAEGAVRMEEEHTELQTAYDALQTSAAADTAALSKLRDDHAALVADHESTCALLGKAQADLQSATAFSTSAEASGVDEAKERAGAFLAMKMAADERVAAAVAAAVEEAALEKAAAIAAEHQTHVAAVEALAAEHASKQSMLEEMLVRAQHDASEATAELDAMRTEVESLRLKVASTEVPLPPAAKAKLNLYSEARARLVLLENEAAATNKTTTSCRLAAARREVNNIFEEMSTGIPSKQPVAKAHVSNGAILARRERSSVAKSLEHAMATTHVPLNAAIACCDHDHTGVVISAAEFDLGSTTGGHIGENEPNDLTTQKGRVKAAVTAISNDLKRVFAIKQSFYRNAIALPLAVV